MTSTLGKQEFLIVLLAAVGLQGCISLAAWL